MREFLTELTSGFALAKPEHIADVGYKGSVIIMKVEYDRLMKEAITLRRKKIALSRAEAIEGAYDYLLRLGTKGEYERTGEVNVNRKDRVAQAFCSSLPKATA